jgi:alkylated DNA repair dioxygenase AlkB
MAQMNLFNDARTEEIAIHGLTIIPDYITRTCEASLINHIDQQPWITDLKRRVQHYGYRYDYKARNVSHAARLDKMPEWLTAYCHGLTGTSFFPHIPDQVIINEYQPGQGIAAHIDCVPCFCDTIASLSLGSPCMMDFTHSQSLQKIAVLLEPRSLIVLSGDARYIWQHGIPARKTDRYHGTTFSRSRRISLTFRNVIIAE